MPRNSSGTYSLYTPGNPVVTSTVISSTWANNTLADLASAITDSLSRSGDGGMQAPLELDNGAVGAPALTWATETTSGWYRQAAGNFRFSISAADVLTLTAAATTIATPTVIGAATGGAQGAGTINATGVYDDGVLLANQAGANPTGTIGLSAVNGVATTFLRSDAAPALSQAIAPTWTGKHTFSAPGGNNAWQATGASNAYTTYVLGNATAGQSFGSLINAGTNSSDAALLIQNQAGSADFLRLRGDGSVAFGNVSGNPTFTTLGTGATTHGGELSFTVGGTSYSAGYRGIPSRTITTSDNTAATDNGRTVLFTGAGSQTFTVDSDFGTAGNVMTILNGGTGSLAIAESLSGTMTWLNGSGSLSTGSRTLAIGGIVTIWMVDATNAYIWGTGVT
jgi:hypothetical protein